MRYLVMVVLVLAVSGVAWCAPVTDLLAPDAVGAIVPIGGYDNNVEMMSWRVATWYDRSLWLDLLEPTDYCGIGVSGSPIPDDPLCVGIGYLDDRWTAYFGAHFDVTW